MIRSKALSTDINASYWYKICTFTTTVTNYYSANAYTLSIPSSYSTNILISIACGLTPSAPGFATDRLNSSIIATNSTYTGDIKIGYKISDDKKSCSVYTKATTNMSRLSYASIISCTSERTIPNIKLDMIPDTTIDETYFDKVQILYNNATSMVKLSGTTDTEFNFYTAKVFGTIESIGGGKAREFVICPRGTANIGVTVLLFGRYGIVAFMLTTGNSNQTIYEPEWNTLIGNPDNINYDAIRDIENFCWRIHVKTPHDTARIIVHSNLQAIIYAQNTITT